MDETPPGGWSALIAWPLSLAVLYLVIGILVVGRAADAKALDRERHAARLDPTRTEEGRTQADPMLPEGKADDPTEVKVGVYVDRIEALSLRENRWHVDFYLWFRWSNDAIDPGATFQIIDGAIDRGGKELVDQSRNGAERYALYRVKATITKFFNLELFPSDDHVLTIRIEDKDHAWYRLKYVPDEEASSVSSRAQVAGYDIRDAQLVEKLHSYRTTRGYPKYPKDFKATYSQVIYAISIQRPSHGIYFKIFQSLFAAVAVAFLAFFVEPDSSPRFGVGVGAFFASVAAAYVTAQQLPPTGAMTQADLVTGIGIVTVFLTIVHSTVALHLWEKKHNRPWSRLLDRMAFGVFLVGYVAVNWAMAAAASS